MSRPRIVEVNYFEFQRALVRATNAGHRIDRTQKERWSKWVAENRVKEAAFRSIGQGRFTGLEPVIIDEEGEWRGYYLVSTTEEACLKWERAGPDAS